VKDLNEAFVLKLKTIIKWKQSSINDCFHFSYTSPRETLVRLTFSEIKRKFFEK